MYRVDHDQGVHERRIEECQRTICAEVYMQAAEG